MEHRVSKRDTFNVSKKWHGYYLVLLLLLLPNRTASNIETLRFIENKMK